MVSSMGKVILEPIGSVDVEQQHPDGQSSDSSSSYITSWTLSTNPGHLLFQLPPNTAGRPETPVCSSPGLPPRGLLPERPSFLSAVTRLPSCLAFSWHQPPSSAPLIMTVSSSQSSAPSLQNPCTAQAVSKDTAMMVE